MNVARLFLIVSVVILVGCGAEKVSNRVDKEMLLCGNESRPAAHEWLSPTNLPDFVGFDKLAQLEVLRLDKSRKFSEVAVTRKGCLLTSPPSAGDVFIVKAEKLKAVLDGSTASAKRLEFLKDEPQYFVTIDSPKRQFSSLDSIPLAATTELSLKHCFRKLESPVNDCLDEGGLSLWENPAYRETGDSIQELPAESGDYRLYVLGRDIFDQSSVFTFDLEINNTRPDIKPDFVSPLRQVQFQQQDGFMVDADYKLGFSSNKPLNQLTIRYCFRSGLDPAVVLPTACQGAEQLQFDAFNPQRFQPGFWAIQFQVEDLAGNRSPWSLQYLLVKQECEAADLNQFPVPFCTHIRGSLLSSILLQEVPVEAFRYLVEVDGRLEITANSDLENWVEPFENLRSVGSLVLIGNAIKSLTIFHKLRTIRDSLELKSNIFLKDLSGLEGLQSIPKNLAIHDNSDLESLKGLESLRSVGGRLSILGISKLRDISGLRNLRNLVDLEIRQQEYLEELGNFSQLREVQNLILDELPILNDLRGFSQLQRVENITLQNLGRLRNLQGLESVRHIRGETNIRNNPSLQDLTALRGVEDFSFFNIVNNDSLVKLFSPAEGSNWPSILLLEVSDNDSLCENLDVFFPLDENLHVRKIEGNCKETR